jgi:hypothetical protein
VVTRWSFASRLLDQRWTIDLTLQGVVAATSAAGDTNQVVPEMLQRVADIPLGDWFEYVIGPPVMDLTAAPYGGARYPVEARMDERIFARFLGSSTGVGINLIANRERAIDGGRNPVIHAAWLKRNRTTLVVEAADARGRILRGNHAGSRQYQK